MRKQLEQWFKSRILARSSIDNRYALIEACLIGVLSGLAALFLKQGIGWLGGWRIKTAYEYGAIVTLPLTGLVFGILAGWLIELLSPAAAGGGIPQVKAALARYPIPLNLRVALVKAIGTILVLGAGLTLGRRGPTVHIGAALASQLSSWIPNSPTNRRQMIAAGAAAGLAAGFNTPIAGVLFVIEELMRDVSGLTLETAIVASFTGAVVSRSLDSADDLNILRAMLSSSRQGSFAAQEIPFYIVLGILAGIVGALYNRSIIFGMQINRKLPLPMPLRMGLAGLISGVIIAFLPAFFRDNAGLREFLISGELSWQITAIAFVVYFCLTILAYSAGTPGGLFAPALVLGSALGYLVGMAEVALIGTESAYTFALAGMGAFFTAVVRVPVTAIVIVFEMTTDFNLVLPLMIGSAVAYVVAESFYRGSIYQHLLSASGIQIQEETPNYDFLSKLKAVDVMQSKVETLSSSLTVEEAIKAMSRSSHRGFPVMEEGKLVGIITQSDLASASNKNDSVLLQDVMTPRPIAVNPNTSLSDVLYLLNRYQLSRLPVTEGNKLIGIITQSDIIKAEVQQLSGDREVTVKPEPSYLVYRTRSPATGRGRILLPLSNPENASSLFQIATAIARYQKYEIDCLQVISVPKYIYPAQAQVNLANSRRLMARLEKLGRKQNLPIHTQVRVATDTAEAILEAIASEQIDLLLMGWKGSTASPEQIFGSVVDTLIKQAPCDLMLVKLGQKPYAFPNKLERQGLWLIPTAGGANTQKALKILPALANMYSLARSPKIRICQVYSPSQSELPLQHLNKTAESLRDKINLLVTILPIRAYSPSEAIIRLTATEKYDLVVIGASSEGLLQNAVYGNITEEIAREVDSTVIIFRNSL